MDVIFDSPNLRVLHRIGRTDTAWITFAASDWEGAFGDRFVEARGDTGVFFIPKADHWYQCPDIWSALREAYLATAGRRRITYGSSKGGFAALAYARELRADLIIAAAPQVSIHPDDVAYFDTRWTDIGPRLTGGRREARGGCAGIRTIVLYDPLQSADSVHAALIGGRHVHLPFSGHASLRAVAQAGALPDLMSALADDAPERLASAIAKLHANRKKTPHYFLTLAEYAFAHRSWLAAVRFSVRALCLDLSLDAALYVLVEALTKLERHDLAAEVARITLNTAGQKIAFAFVLMRNHWFDDAEAMLYHALAHHPDAPEVSSAFGTLYQAQGPKHYARSAEWFAKALALRDEPQWRLDLEYVQADRPAEVGGHAGGGSVGGLGEDQTLAASEDPAACALHPATVELGTEEQLVDVWYGLKVPHC